MKIVNRETFLTLPPGTVFAEYTPCIVGDMRIKGETAPNKNDWLYQEINLAIHALSSVQMFDLLEEAEKTGQSVPMNFTIQSRDGAFDYDQRYAIYEKQDVEALIKRLQEALRDAEAV